MGVKSNQAAFRWSRKAAFDLPAGMRETVPAQAVLMPMKSQTLASLVTDRVVFLTNDQTAEHACTSRLLVERSTRAGQAARRKSDVPTKAVASNEFKLMAHRDEYEGARRYSDERSLKKLSKGFLIGNDRQPGSPGEPLAVHLIKKACDMAMNRI